MTHRTTAFLFNVLCFAMATTIAVGQSPGSHPMTDQFGHMGIGTLVPDKSAILDLSSTSAGFLLPRMTSAQRSALVNPAPGLMIYNTDTKTIEFNIGTSFAPAWDPVVTSSSGSGLYWQLAGNSGTNPAVNFLGTTDAQPLVVRTNGTERLRVASTGEVGIGTSSPTLGRLLEVAGTAGTTNVRFASVGGVPSGTALTGNEGVIIADGNGDLSKRLLSAIVPASWELTGNSGTTPGTNFLGTIDSTAFEIKVFSSNASATQGTRRVMRYEPTAVSPNIIGGYHGNTVSGSVGATIAGGGGNDGINSVSAAYGTVSGGRANTTTSYFSTVSGGDSNSVSGAMGNIGGGRRNVVAAPWGAIGGGNNNTVNNTWGSISGGQSNMVNSGATWGAIAGGQGNTVNSTWGAIGGGQSNEVNGPWGTVGGGQDNTAGWSWSTVAGGRNNQATTTWSTIGGGYNNTANGSWATIAGGGNSTAGTGAFIGGGDTNTASGYTSVIAGGSSNSANGSWSSLGGGQRNNASGTHSRIGGGENNTASATWSGVNGGFNNTASGVWSFVGGGRNNVTSSTWSFVGGGQDNTVSGTSSFVGGGDTNRADGTWSSVVGGHRNRAAGTWSFVGGGHRDTATGTWSAVAGGRMNKATGTWSFIGSGDTNLASGTWSSVVGGQSNKATSSWSGIVGGQGNQTIGSWASIGGGLNNVADSLSAIPGGQSLKLGGNSFGFNGDTTVPTTVTDLSAGSFRSSAYFGNTDVLIGNVDGNARDLRLYEPNTSFSYSGTNYTAFQAQVQASNITYTLPAINGTSGQMLAVAASPAPTATTATLEWASVVTTPTGPATGDLTGNYPNPSIAASAVTSAKILDSTITTADISPTAAIHYSKLSLTNSIQNSDIVPNAITTSKVANGTVTTSKLADSAVSGLKLLTFAVTNRHIADGAVTLPKLSATGALTDQVIGYNGTSIVWMNAPTPTGPATGDLTGNYPNPSIATSAVTSAKILDSTITTADISAAAAIPYSKLVLTNSIQNSDIVANAVTTSKVANGTVTTSKLADSAVSGLKLLTFAVTNRHIADGAVTLPKLSTTGASTDQVIGYNGTSIVWMNAPTPSGPATGDLTGNYPNPSIATSAVTSAKILDSTITTADISPTAAIHYSKLSLTNSIQNSDIVPNAITTSKVANGTVTTSKLADSAVSGLKLLTFAVTNRHIADGAVTLPKLSTTGASTDQVIGYNGTAIVWMNAPTAAPKTSRTDVTTVTTGNVTLNATGASFLRITVSTGAFTVTGLSGGVDGQIVVVYNQTANNMTISNEDAGEGTAANRVHTMFAGNITTTGEGQVTLMYDGGQSRWIDLSSRP